MVHWGRELLSEAGYFHSVSMWDDPYRIRRACEKAGVQLSGLSAHTPLVKPDVGTDYLKQAIRFAVECGAPVVNTDEGPKQPWTTEEEDHVLMRYTLMEAAKVAEPRDVLTGVEPHQQYTKHPDGLDRIHGLVDSPAIGINFDTERGKVTGTPVGCACGDGVIDWAQVAAICRECQRDMVFSVECGTVDQAERSIRHLEEVLA